MTHQTLKEQHRACRDQHPELVRLRVHRALSWLDRAEQCDDLDGRFIFLWIAFNACYAKEIVEAEYSTETRTFGKFARTLVKLDKDGILAELVWAEFNGPIRVLLKNHYVYEPFWEYQRGKRTEASWQAKFKHENATAQKALTSQRTEQVLSTVLRRMYTLRNQLIHGGATWNSAVNREQLRDCTSLLEKLVQQVIKLIMANPNTAWGEVCYPVIARP